MKLKVVVLISMFFIGVAQATILNNQTGYDVKVKVAYLKQCLPAITLLDEATNKDFAELTFTLPAGLKIDISGSQIIAKNRQDGNCYNDIYSLKVTMDFVDTKQNIVNETSNIWYANPTSGIDIAKARIINLFYSRNTGMSIR